MNGSHTALIMRKGHSLRYAVAWNSSRGEQFSSVPPGEHSFLLSDLGDGVARVTAFNSAGSSPPSSVWVPEASPVATDRVSGSGGGFNLSWPASAGAICGYIVEWGPAHQQDWRVEWMKVPHPSASIPPKHFQAGVRYLLSIYACSQGRPHLLARKEGYAEEMAPNKTVQKLEGNPSGSGVQFHWDMVPPEGQHGFICGYHIYLNSSSGYKYEENIKNPDARDYTMRNVPPGWCTFKVTAYNSAGEGPEATLQYLVPVTESACRLIFSTLSAMAFYLIFTIICYQKRNWIKETLFPIISKPRVPQDLSTPTMFSSQTLDLEKCPYDRVEVFLSNEDSGEVPGEENGWSMCSPDSSSTPLMRCYQQAPSRTSHWCVPQAHPASPSGITSTLLQPPRAPPQPALSSGQYQPQGSAENGPQGSTENGPQGSGQYQPQGSVENGPQGSVENGPQGSVENGPQGSALLVDDGYQPQGSVENGPQGSAENGPQGSVENGPQGSVENGPQGSATAQLPLQVDDGYQPFPSLSTASPGPGGLDTPTSANSFTFLLGGASVSPASANPVRVNRPLPHKNYTNPTYQPIDYTHM
ncbi:oncostatin-M-specific receptor subunit beta-like isoform X2 [Conger conger]|nr:oncostatin-M-specific receptor subunit beta-like isoform X2 [Conger conger]